MNFKELQQVETLVYDDFLQSYVPQNATYGELAQYQNAPNLPTNHTPSAGAKQVQLYEASPRPQQIEQGQNVGKFQPSEHIGETAKATTHPIFFILVACVGGLTLGVWGVLCAVAIVVIGIFSGLSNIQEARNQHLGDIVPPTTPTPATTKENKNIVINNYITVNNND